MPVQCVYSLIICKRSRRAPPLLGYTHARTHAHTPVQYVHSLIMCKRSRRAPPLLGHDQRLQRTLEVLVHNLGILIQRCLTRPHERLPFTARPVAHNHLYIIYNIHVYIILHTHTHTHTHAQYIYMYTYTHIYYYYY